MRHHGDRLSRNGNSSTPAPTPAARRLAQCPPTHGTLHRIAEADHLHRIARPVILARFTDLGPPPPPLCARVIGFCSHRQRHPLPVHPSPWHLHSARPTTPNRLSMSTTGVSQRGATPSSRHAAEVHYAARACPAACPE